MSDMTTCLNDLSYIPSNNEQNEPTQGDIGETSNQPTQAKHNEFKELYVSATEDLYPGCDSVTRLDFMAKFTHFKCTEPGKMQHPVDGRAWKKFDTRYPKFAAEPRNVRLGLAADGFNPFDNLSQSYSMWPVILTTYNLPP
ncbi:reverse transcriptase domain-containing protein, partial [Tanacetum coccineum]